MQTGLDDESLLPRSAYSRSPWEALSSSPSPSSGLSDVESVSQLVPEVEEGNIEYKLKLCHPTPERFTRLVTQLKWRLLAGTGQALYEIGVSDSGQLVGLSRVELEESLETLERMAGELGATVIIQKEVTLPSPGRPVEKPRYNSSGNRLKLSLPLEEFSPSSDDTGNSSDEQFLPLPNFPFPFEESSTAPIDIRNSLQPIIRNFPYGQGPRAFAITSRTTLISPPYPTLSLADAEKDESVDDDAAFSFDLDINNIVKSTAKFSISDPVGKPSTPSPPLPSLVPKKRTILPSPVDPLLKAKQRRARRDERREQRRKEAEALQHSMNGFSQAVEVAYGKLGREEHRPPAIVVSSNSAVGRGVLDESYFRVGRFLFLISVSFDMACVVLYSIIWQ